MRLMSTVICRSSVKWKPTILYAICGGRWLTVHLLCESQSVHVVRRPHRHVRLITLTARSFVTTRFNSRCIIVPLLCNKLVCVIQPFIFPVRTRRSHSARIQISCHDVSISVRKIVARVEGVDDPGKLSSSSSLVSVCHRTPIKMLPCHSKDYASDRSPCPVTLKTMFLTDHRVQSF